ncbi:hypothetical protein ACX80Z_15380 [Arthrobacter sp. TMT4-20]
MNLPQNLAIPALALIALTGCSGPPTQAAESTTVAAPAETESATEFESASGTIVGAVGVLKNYFFNYQDDYCEGQQIKGTTEDYLTYLECPGVDTYFWLFSDEEQRDALMPEIQDMGMPFLVAEDWVITSELDMANFQAEYGGALNP